MVVPHYYNYEYCKEIASHYKTRREFHDAKSNQYKYSSKMGWLDDFFGKKTEYTYEYCKEVASQYKKRVDLLKANESLYRTCSQRGWLDDFFGCNPINREKGASIYDYDTCQAIAKKCKSAAEMNRTNPRAYVVARKNNWLYQFFEHQRILTYQFCKEVASKFSTKQELNKNDSGVYCKCCKNGWINEFFNNENTPVLEIEISKYCIEHNINFEYRKRDFKWLRYKKNMELDFYFPDYGAAIECQGIQHYEPREFLGGEKSYKETIKRDEHKKKLCNENNVRLYYYTTYKNHKKENTYTDVESLFNILLSN